MSEASGRPIEILLVEDNPGDVRLMTETFKEGKIKNRLWVVEDGIEAIAFLRREGNYAPSRGQTLSCSISACRG